MDTATGLTDLSRITLVNDTMESQEFSIEAVECTPSFQALVSRHDPVTDLNVTMEEQSQASVGSSPNSDGKLANETYESIKLMNETYEKSDESPQPSDGDVKMMNETFDASGSCLENGQQATSDAQPTGAKSDDEIDEDTVVDKRTGSEDSSKLVDDDVTTDDKSQISVTKSPTADATPAKDGVAADAAQQKTPTSSKESSSEKEVKGKTVTRKPAPPKKPIQIEHKKPNVAKVRSSLADYINTPPPKPKPKDPPKDLTTLTVKKKPAASPKELTPEREPSVSKSEDSKASSPVKVEKEPPKPVKRTTPKSKWDSIMTNIKSNKTTVKPKAEIKSKLFEPTVASAMASPAAANKKVEKQNAKNDAKNLQLQKRRLSAPMPDFSNVKSKLGSTNPRKMSLKPGDEVGGKLIESRSNRSSRSDLHTIGEEIKMKTKSG